MIVTEHVKINHTPLEKIDLNHAIITFDDIKYIDLDLLTINKKCIKNTNTASYEIRYITMQNGIYEKVLLCPRFTDVDAYFIEENENKYLVFTLTKNNKKISVRAIQKTLE